MPLALATYTMTLLRCRDRFLMLERAGDKRFAPGRWTGIGGRVESSEYGDLHAAALREIDEETGIQPDAINDLTLRRALLQTRPGHPLTTLLYFTGELGQSVTPACPEGTLHWLTASGIARVDVIENTALVIPLLIEDLARDPRGSEPAIVGAADFAPSGALTGITWTW